MLNKLVLWKKLAIFAVLGTALVAGPLYMYIKMSSRDVAAATLEQQGISPIKSLLEVVKVTQQHRALSATVLNGNTAAEGDRKAKQADVEKAVESFSAVAKQIEDPAIRDAWGKGVEDWKSLASGVGSRSINGKESFARHTALVAVYLAALDRVADHYGVSLDPEADSYNLVMASVNHLPQLAETLGQMRARGSAVLTQAAMSAEERTAIAALSGMIDLHAKNMARSLGKAIEGNAKLKAKLDAPAKQSRELVEKAVRFGREKVIEAAELNTPAKDYIAQFTETIDAQIAFNAVVLGEVDALLTARVESLRKGQVVVLGSIAAVVVLALWLGMLVTRSITGPVAEAQRIAEALARGDLTQRVVVRSRDEIGQLMAALGATVESLSGMMQRIRASSDMIGTASAQIAAGNADLSQRTEEQASSLEETASSMEELASTVKQNADNAKQANALTDNASEVAVKGGAVVGEVVQTMSAINGSSKKIAEIISVIDGIAFQTNILALNAAVEAARAGEQGRGFAVVASEVRSLAQRSASAAKEIKDLISDSVQKVESGTRLVDDAGRTMDEVVASVKRVTEIMGDISGAAQEQSSGIEQVNQAVMQMDQVTQQNAALVEQAAAAAESMREQAAALAREVSVFKLAEVSGGKPAAVAPAVKRGGSAAGSHAERMSVDARRLAA